MKSLLSFLKGAVKASVEKLVEGFVKEVAKTTTFNEVMTVKAIAAITVLRGVKMEEELKLFFYFITSECGRMGHSVPATVVECFPSALTTNVSVVLAPKLVVAPLPPATTPKPAAVPAIPAAVQTAPPRIIEGPAERLKKFFGILASFLKGARIDFKKTQDFAASVLPNNLKLLSLNNWETLFGAMKEADQNGLFILGNEAKPARIFAVAPSNLLDDYVFGQDGAMVTTLADFNELDSDTMPGWLVAKTSVLLDAVLALDNGNGLDEFAVERVENILTAIEKLDGPSFLVEKAQSILITSGSDSNITPAPATEKIGNGGARIIGDLKSLVKQSDATTPAPEPAPISEAAAEVMQAAVDGATAAKADFIIALETVGKEAPVNGTPAPATEAAAPAETPAPATEETVVS